MASMTAAVGHGPLRNARGCNSVSEGDDVVYLLEELQKELAEMQARMASEIDGFMASMKSVAVIASSRSASTVDQPPPKEQHTGSARLFHVPHAVQDGADDGADFDTVGVSLPGACPCPVPPPVFSWISSEDTSGECASKDAVQETKEWSCWGRHSRLTRFWHDRAIELLSAGGSAEACASRSPVGDFWLLHTFGLDGRLARFISVLCRHGGGCRDLCAVFPFGFCLSIIAVVLGVSEVVVDMMEDHGDDEEMHHFHAFWDAVMIFGTLCSILMHHGWHTVAGQALSPSQEASLMTKLLWHSGSGCEATWRRRSRWQQWYLTLVWLLATALKVCVNISAVRSEEELWSYEFLMSSIGFFLVSGLNTAIAFRMVCTFGALKTSLSCVAEACSGGIKLGMDKTQATLRQTRIVSNWCALEASSRCISISISPLLLNILIVAPLQAAVVVLQLLLNDLDLKHVVHWLLPHAALGALPASALCTAASINKTFWQIPAMFHSVLAEDFRHSSYKDFMDVMSRCRPVISIGDLRIDFTAVTRMIYVVTVLSATLVTRQLQLEMS
mmetsp:Transcript_63625/g.186110  ORF Transcript_63625/g.186110 Transcript_63625/m.186110 type:complete len:558 (-) Transcript_63625:67-1740(-)